MATDPPVVDPPVVDPPPPADPPAADAELEAIRSDPATAVTTIRALKSEAADYRRRLRAAEEERDKLQREGLSDREREVEEAKAAGRAESDAKHGRELLEAQLRAAAAGKLQNPGDAILLLDVDELLARDPADRDLDKAIEKLLEERKYLAVENGKPAGGSSGVPPGSRGPRSQPGTPNGESDGSAWLRKAARRG